MSYGFAAYNSSGYLLIDNTYQNLSLQVKQTFSLSSGATTTVTYSNGVSPLLFINSSGYTGILQFGVSGTTYTWIIHCASTSTGSFYIFDQPLANATTGYGMIVRNAAGSQVFNSTNKYLRVVDLLSVSFSISGDVGVSGPTVNATYPSATYAVCVAQPRANVILSSGGNTLTVDGIQTTSTGVSIACNNSVTYPYGTVLPYTVGLFQGSGSVPAMVCNVSGY